MLKNKRGFSLVILVIAITVLIIISSTAVISIRNITKDREISNFMNDLANVKQYVIEYVSRNNYLPIKNVSENGVEVNAESRLLQLLENNSALDQVDTMDTGTYYFVDINKLGKIHLSESDRGYIMNEGTLNIYVTTPQEYENVNYYTLTPYLTGKEVAVNGNAPFEIIIQGNPISWATNAEILVSVANVRLEEADGWNFKWLKGSHSADDFRTADTVNYFNYGDTISFRENGVYTVCVENPEGKANVRKIVVTKIDDIVPTISMVGGKMVIDDAETGVRAIYCKIDGTTNFPINTATREANKDIYTSENILPSDSERVKSNKYLWGNDNIKGNTIDEYLKEYESYYEQLMVFRAIISNTEATSGERANAESSIALLNRHYPQFAYDNTTFPNTEQNIVIYVEDMAGNSAVYSALSRNELISLQYITEANETMVDAKIVINNNNTYTNSGDVTVYLQAMYAKEYFLTEEQVQEATWSNFNSSTKQFTLSSDNGEKTLYGFFKDESGKVVSCYDKIILDTEPPTDTAPIVTYSANRLTITVKQTDSLSGLTGTYRYGVKKSTDDNYTWYTTVSNIPALDEGVTYQFKTEATDRAGNVQRSEPTTYTNNSNAVVYKVGDVVAYTPISPSEGYLTKHVNTGTDSDERVYASSNLTWKIISINSITGDMIVTPGITNSKQIKLKGMTAFIRGASELHTICETLYSNSTKGITARNMTLSEINYANSYTPTALEKTAFYENDIDLSMTGEGNTISVEENGEIVSYVKRKANNTDYFFYVTEGVYGGRSGDTVNGFSTVQPYHVEGVGETQYYPVYMTRTFYSYTPNATIGNMIGGSIGDRDVGWLATPSLNLGSSPAYHINYGMRFACNTMVNAGRLARSYTDPFAELQFGLIPVITLHASDLTGEGIEPQSSYEPGSVDNPWGLR